MPVHIVGLRHLSAFYGQIQYLQLSSYHCCLGQMNSSKSSRLFSCCCLIGFTRA
uniref:Uncharacterized protein n=1 Tax=Rhizophora mucronata TaxID=61149 RepID=A0A2P2QCX9_RHIMU